MVVSQAAGRIPSKPLASPARGSPSIQSLPTTAHELQGMEQMFKNWRKLDAKAVQLMNQTEPYAKMREQKEGDVLIRRYLETKRGKTEIKEQRIPKTPSANFSTAPPPPILSSISYVLPQQSFVVNSVGSVTTSACSNGHDSALDGYPTKRRKMDVNSPTDLLTTPNVSSGCSNIDSNNVTLADVDTSINLTDFPDELWKDIDPNISFDQFWPTEPTSSSSLCLQTPKQDNNNLNNAQQQQLLQTSISSSCLQTPKQDLNLNNNSLPQATTSSSCLQTPKQDQNNIYSGVSAGNFLTPSLSNMTWQQNVNNGICYQTPVENSYVQQQYEYSNGHSNQQMQNSDVSNGYLSQRYAANQMQTNYNTVAYVSWPQSQNGNVICFQQEQMENNYSQQNYDYPSGNGQLHQMPTNSNVFLSQRYPSNHMQMNYNNIVSYAPNVSWQSQQPQTQNSNNVVRYQQGRMENNNYNSNHQQQQQYDYSNGHHQMPSTSTVRIPNSFISSQSKFSF